MGAEYLSEAAVFACPLGMRFKAEEMSNRKAKYKGKKLLTSAAVLVPKQPPIPCSFLPPLPSGPPPCPCVVGPIGGRIKHRATENLLTMDAKAMCVAGKKVKPIQSGTERRVVYKDARHAQGAAIVWPVEASQAVGNTPAAETSNDGTKLPFPHETLRQADKAAVVECATNPQTEGESVFRTGMLCSVSKSNPVCASCAYCLDTASATVDNDSAVLRKNYNAAKPHTDKYDRYFDEKVEPLGDSKPGRWRYVAHHLISGNQVFKRNTELVRLARFCGYDINAYGNCIMLVGYPEDYPDAERMKSVKAYDVMSEGRVQWHVGGHSYTFTDDEKAMICKQIGIRNKIRLSPADIKTYAELVQEELDKLKQRLETKKNRQQVCYVGQQEKRQFCDKLDRISQKIKTRLAAFSDVGKPHHSFPYFVSKEAYRYTYGLPRTGKVIAVLKEKNRLFLSIYRLEHFTEAIAEQERSLAIKPGKAKEFALGDESWPRECIFFCDNVKYFVYLEDTPRDILPFAVDAAHQFPAETRNTGRDGLRFLEENDTELLVWLRDNADASYVSPALMVRKRWGEYQGRGGTNVQILPYGGADQFGELGKAGGGDFIVG